MTTPSAPQDGRLQLSIVVPAFNEERRLPATLTEILAILAGGGTDFEILVVDDGSQDATAKVVESFDAKSLE